MVPSVELDKVIQDAQQLLDTNPAEEAGEVSATVAFRQVITQPERPEGTSGGGRRGRSDQTRSAQQPRQTDLPVKAYSFPFPATL